MSSTQEDALPEQGEHTFFPAPPQQKVQRLCFSEEFRALPWPKKITAYFGFIDVELFEGMPVPGEDGDGYEDAEEGLAHVGDESVAPRQEDMVPDDDYEDDLE